MEKFLKKFIAIFMIFILVCLNSINSKAIDKKDIIGEVLNIAKAEIIEVGVETIFNEEKDINSYCEELKKSISYYGYDKEKIIVKNHNDYIEVKIDNLNVIIEKIDYKDNMIKMTVSQKTKYNNLDFLKNLTKTTFKNEKHINQYLYVKSSFDDENCNLLNKHIVDFLDKNGATDLETVPLENGFSTICNTKMYNSKEIFRKKIDFQFAIMKYSRENYLIIGTPEITVAF
ncbi:hypothetical protein [Clostridium sp. ATCC 25772]|uniref:hypothetical protein n=1 Tax=Clostridium sp. ATCC 25772 TaxID=1676991 RepID=UPI0007841BA7|nr:hypothetical protein [Clostridium sp. ATCC 25772]